MQQSEGGNADIKMQCAAQVTAAYLSNNHVAVTDIPALVSTISQALEATLSPTPAVAVVEKKEPAVAIRKSITPDFLIDLFSGRKFKSLKRYLRTTHNMTPEQYRAYWDLPKDYPMVAPAYAAKRSELAKSMGLGQGGRQKTKAAAAPAPAPAKVAAAPKRAKKAAPVAAHA